MTTFVLCFSRIFVFMTTATVPNSELKHLSEELEGSTRVLSIGGLTSVSAKSFVLAKLQRISGKSFAIVTDSNSSLDDWEKDLAFWSSLVGDGSDARIVTLPSFETDVYSGVSPHAETQERRALGLWQLTQSQPEFLVLSARSLITRTSTPDQMGVLGAVLERDENFPLEEFTNRLSAVGYVREDPVNGVGQFSIRGGIVDVWPPDSTEPLRIEFFGDTVDSIRAFDPETQLSTGQLKAIPVSPMREFAASEADLKDWAYFASERWADENLARNLRDRTDFAEQGESFSGWEFLLPLVKPFSSSVFDYLSDVIFVIDEPSTVESVIGKFYDDLHHRYAKLAEAGDIGLEPHELFLHTDDFRQKLGELRLIELRALGRTAAATDEQFQIPDDVLTVGSNNNAASRVSTTTTPMFLFPTTENSSDIEITSRSTRKFHGNIADFVKSAKQPSGSNVPLFVMQTRGMAERIEEILREYEVVVSPDSIVVGQLSGGVEMPTQNLIVYTEGDIFGETSETAAPAKRTQPTTRKSVLGAFISDFRDLKASDYVVHVDHGIGRFEGLQTLESGGIQREFMLLIYADNSKLFVPVERLDLVSRFSSGEAAEVTLDRLGGIGWQKTKAKAKRAMRDMADELLRLYAERKLVQGYAFSPDAPWQHEFEDAFPFELTVDQAAAIEDVKNDMETAIPMDRLIIGDVGYGKTEVAMRAAFKAVMDGKQVAILTPTTILAYQHFESFRKRFAAFPAKIDLLSRFRSSKEQKAVVESAEKGDVDVVIGTHRILSNDVKLPKLGLVVVDEEQRFGVAHKEKLKQLKKKVDVLTLSATPIPRTLNMSLLGMRDLSVIETPPRDRLAINTQVVQFGESVIRSAIELELARNGQVFFIHNRVETIEAIAALVQKIVPNARIAIGHGQMNEKQMEQVMLDFIDFKYDILVATTIIENGIDIPRANTIIINRADNYGLSQLYQLRGRVGRSNRRAYAYMLIPSEMELTPIARRRLSAIREFSDLGAGFRIAALDLELRGAGNILGGQQSGHLDALGFDLYTKMLERTIAELRGDEISDETSVSINLGVDVSIPKNYISDTSQRLRTYKRISSAESDMVLNQIHSEIGDRYGQIPNSVENLFAYGRLRKLAEIMKVVSIDKTVGGFAIKLMENAKISPEKLMKFLSENEDAVFSHTGILRIAAGTENPVKTANSVLNQIRS